jgi:hypothetical protein
MWQSHVYYAIVRDFYNVKKMPKKSLNISPKDLLAQEKFSWILTFLMHFFLANKS